MSKAGAGCRKISRRATIAAALGACGAHLPHGGLAAAVAADPITELIAAHRAAVAAFEAAARHLCDVEEGVADDGGQDRGTGDDHDPFFLAALAAFDAADDVAARTAWALASARFTSLAAAAALLRYVADVDADRDAWPEPPDGDDGRNWVSTFHRNLAAALDEMIP